MKALGDGKIFEGQLVLIERGNFGREFEDARTPGDELLADELISVLPAKIGAPGQHDGAGSLLFLKLLLHRCEEKLLLGIAIRREFEKGGADGGDFVCYVGGSGSGFLDLLLEQKAFELVVIDTDGNDDSADGAIVGGETAADFLGGAVEPANGEESVRAGADEEGEEPTESDKQQAADFFGVFVRLQVGGAVWRSGGV